jgi:hypothetical protein
MMDDKLEFLRNDFIFNLKHLAPDATGLWGVMNGQQMVEHFSEAVKNASGKLKLPQVNHGEKLEKFRRFLMSDKPFNQNTKNPLLGETPPAAKHSTIQAAIAELQQEIDHFIETFKKNPQLTTQNPFFGQLTFEENVQLLYKHAQHHLKQFGLISPN